MQEAAQVIAIGLVVAVLGGLVYLRRDWDQMTADLDARNRADRDDETETT